VGPGVGAVLLVFRGSWLQAFFFSAQHISAWNMGQTVSFHDGLCVDNANSCLDFGKEANPVPPRPQFKYPERIEWITAVSYSIF
jgi:hypothetical protein